ncbi:MAG: hypothetical protein QS721_03195 [Candidatus Endonucleobacter sp. (ex Gigantidas childressi)]|nr:hypothetical protein [Candidatus Endonucleobacter sp. (ex Gigantidas childressi)]
MKQKIIITLFIIGGCTASLLIYNATTNSEPAKTLTKAEELKDKRQLAINGKGRPITDQKPINPNSNTNISSLRAKTPEHDAIMQI